MKASKVETRVMFPKELAVLLDVISRRRETLLEAERNNPTLFQHHNQWAQLVDVPEAQPPTPGTVQ